MCGMSLLSCYKSINKRIGLFLSDLYSFLKYYVFRREYKRYMKLNSIPNKRVEKEEEYKRKWRVLGRVDPIYYRYYSSFVGNDPNLVPVDLSANIIEPILNPVQYRPYYSDKNMFDKIVPNVSAKTLLRKSNGMYLTHDYLRIHELTESYLSEVCSDYTRIVVKPAKETSGGEGIVIFERMDDGRFVSVFSYDKKEYALSVDFLNRLGDDIVVQEYLEQASFFAQFNDASVNTIRMCIYRSVSSNDPVLLGSVLRIGRKGAHIDNACYGGGFVGINPDGSLCHQVLYKNGVREVLFNGIDFKNDFIIPHYDQIVEFGKKVCSQIIHHRLIALDIMVDKEGMPRLIEFNLQHFSGYLIQTTTTSLFGEYTGEVIDYCKKNISHRSRFIAE